MSYLDLTTLRAGALRAMGLRALTGAPLALAMALPLVSSLLETLRVETAF